jgi:hypothetical protein
MIDLKTITGSKFYRPALWLLGVYGFYHFINGTYFGYEICVSKLSLLHDQDRVDMMEAASLRGLQTYSRKPKYHRAWKLVSDLSDAQRTCVEAHGFDACREIWLGERTKKLSFRNSDSNGPLGSSGIDIEYFEYDPSSKVEFRLVIDSPGCGFRDYAIKVRALE